MTINDGASSMPTPRVNHPPTTSTTASRTVRGRAKGSSEVEEAAAEEVVGADLVPGVVEGEGGNWGRWTRYGRRSVKVAAKGCLTME